MIPNVSTLYQTIKSGAEGGHEFARILTQLLIADANRQSINFKHTDDRAGDFEKVDSILFKNELKIGFQYKFVENLKSSSVKTQVLKSFNEQELIDNGFTHWTLILPNDIDTHDRDWLEEHFKSDRISIDVWGHSHIINLALLNPKIGKQIFPSLIFNNNHSEPTAENLKQHLNSLLEINVSIERILANAQPTIQDCKDIFPKLDTNSLADYTHNQFKSTHNSQSKPIVGDRVYVEQFTLTDHFDLKFLTGGMREAIKTYDFLSPGQIMYSVRFLEGGNKLGYFTPYWFYNNSRWVFFPKIWRFFK